MKRYLISVFLLFLFMLSACTPGRVKDKRTPDFSFEHGSHTVNFTFKLGKEYRLVPSNEMSSEEYEKYREDCLGAPGYLGIYKGNDLVSSISVNSNQSFDPEMTGFEYTYNHVKAEGTLLDEGSTDTFDYLYYTSYKLFNNATIYIYAMVIPGSDDFGFEVSAPEAEAEELKKVFASMEVWLTEYSMVINNIVINKDKETVEADFHPEGKEEALHLVVDMRYGSKVTGTVPESLLEAVDCSIYEMKGIPELWEYAKSGSTEPEFTLKWK